MAKTLGKMIYVDPDQFQQSVETEGLKNYLLGCGVQDIQGFQSKLESVFQKGSARRSFFMMNMSFRDFAANKRARDLRIPVFGVKGQVAGITRASNYTEIFTAPAEELDGTGFTENVFGTSYMTSAEGVERSRGSALAVLERGKKNVPVTISETLRDIASLIVTEIWAAQEKDSRTRIIIRIPDAEEKSMMYLRAVYLLLPASLKMQLGFETNVTMTDLRLINEFHGLPLYVFTVDEKEPVSASGLQFPVHEIRLSGMNVSGTDPARLNLVRNFCANVNSFSIALLDYSDRKWRREHGNTYASFKNYGEILKSVPEPASLIKAGTELDDARAEIADLRKDISNAKAKLQSEQQAHTADVKRLSDKLEQQNRKLQQQDRNLEQQSRKLKQAENKNKALSSQIANLEAYRDQLIAANNELAGIPEDRDSSEPRNYDNDRRDESEENRRRESQKRKRANAARIEERRKREQMIRIAIVAGIAVIVIIILLVSHRRRGKDVTDTVSGISSGTLSETTSEAASRAEEAASSAGGAASSAEETVSSDEEAAWSAETPASVAEVPPSAVDEPAAHNAGDRYNPETQEMAEDYDY